MKAKTSIHFDDFLKTDVRIGTIIEVKDFPEARKPAYRMKIDFGGLGIKTSRAQITTLYSKNELLNKQVVAVINLKPRQISIFLSECLILGIQNDKDVVLLQPQKHAKNSMKVT